MRVLRVQSKMCGAYNYVVQWFLLSVVCQICSVLDEFLFASHFALFYRTSIITLHVRWCHMTISISTSLLRSSGCGSRCLSCLSQTTCQQCEAGHTWTGLECTGKYRTG